MPCCARRVVRVAPIIAKAKPEEMPRKSAASGAGSTYGRIPLAQRVVIIDRQGRVVGEAARLVDRLLHRLCRDAGRGDLIIDAPADVLLPCLTAARPPGVLLGIGIEAPEDIDVAQLVEHPAQPGA